MSGVFDMGQKRRPAQSRARGGPGGMGCDGQNGVLLRRDHLTGSSIICRQSTAITLPGASPRSVSGRISDPSWAMTFSRGPASSDLLASPSEPIVHNAASWVRTFSVLLSNAPSIRTIGSAAGPWPGDPTPGRRPRWTCAADGARHHPAPSNERPGSSSAPTSQAAW